MIKPNQTWSADSTVNLREAHDVQSLLELIVRRYALMGGIIANGSGQVEAQTGGAVSDLRELAAAIDVSTLPRYYANGNLDAYVDIVTGGRIALFMRERPLEGERSELAMVSDYQVAKEMMEELRAHLPGVI